MPGCSDDWFAEHMLPEGAHNHALDWTVMFLNRDEKSLDEDWPRYFEEGEGAGAALQVRARGYCDEAGLGCFFEQQLLSCPWQSFFFISYFLFPSARLGLRCREVGIVDFCQQCRGKELRW